MNCDTCKAPEGVVAYCDNVECGVKYCDKCAPTHKCVTEGDIADLLAAA